MMDEFAAIGAHSLQQQKRSSLLIRDLMQSSQSGYGRKLTKIQAGLNACCSYSM
jgi:hypothetical protein